MKEFELWGDNIENCHISHTCGHAEVVENLEEANEWAEKHLKEHHND